MQKNVHFPSGYFIRSVKSFYSNYKEALIRELIQNSIDAGSTRIDLNFYENSYECIDNGCGMDLEKMEKAMLTFGGSFKEENSTGGFGEAKVLIIFSMKEYEIRSKHVKAFGQHLSYQIKEDFPYFKGTKITGKFDENFDYDCYSMKITAKNFLSKCKFSCKVFINGEEVRTSKYERKVKYIKNLGVLYTKKEPSFLSYVRHNGVMMFQSFIGESDYSFILELEGNSIDKLNSNRDGFCFGYSSEFNFYMKELFNEKNSLAQSNEEEFIFKGKERFIQSIRKSMKECNEEDHKKLKNFLNTVKNMDQKEIEESFNKLQISETKKKEINIDSNLKNDFIVINSESNNKIPKALNPETMSKRANQLALFWKHTLIKVLEILELDMKFNIGWILQKNTVAMYTKKEGKIYFLINPKAEMYKHFMNKYTFTDLLLSAVHEVTHLWENGHNEKFSSVFENNLRKVLNSNLKFKDIKKSVSSDYL